MRLLRTWMVLGLLGQSVFAANFPSNLTSLEVSRIVQVIGLASATRFLRSADPYDLFPGIKMGVEFLLVPSFDINSLGNQDGTLPTINPAPRLYFSKGLFLNLEFMFSFLPSNIINTLSTTGLGIKWTFSNEATQWASGAVYICYTNIAGYNDVYRGDDFELGVIFGKDYVRLKPYIGVGLLFAQGSLTASLVRAGSLNNSWQSTFHVFLGSEIELPVNITFQVDFMNLSPVGSIFVGKKF